MKYLLMFLIAHSIVFSQQKKMEKDTLNSTIHLNEVKLHGDAVLENNKILSANKLHVKPIDLPNSSGVISKRLIEEQQLLTLGEGISAVSGVFQFNKGFGGSSEITWACQYFYHANLYPTGRNFLGGISRNH